jgi:cell division protein FtsI/penicillin-binding protein 2
MRRSILRSVLVLALAAGGIAACSGDGGPDDTVDAFLAGWKSGSLGEVGFVQPDGSKVGAAEVTQQIKSLSGELAAPELRREGEAEVVENVATARVVVDWPLPGGARWSYPTTVRLNEDADGQWAVIWEPKIVNENLEAGDGLALRRLRAPRATVVDGSGEPIFQPRKVVNVAIQPNEVTDPARLTRQLTAAFRTIEPPIPFDLADLPERIQRATEANTLVDVIQLRDEAYQQVKPVIYPLPGTKFTTAERDLAPTRAFARALLGTVDPAFKEDIDKNPDAIAAGDLVGHGGVQGAYDAQLRGTPGTSVIVVRKSPEGEVVPASEKELFRAEPKPGTPVKTTLDVRTQNAADTALADVAKRSAIVALKVSDGSVLAVANGPNGGAVNLAFTAQVPPGSTFKMVSALGLLDKGSVSLDGQVACPKTFTVDGRSFKNSNNFALGDVAFRVDFAKSCNTAFAALAPELGDAGLAEAGRSLGLEGAWDLGVEAFSGKVSTGGSAAERAAAAFGQGTTIVSPLAMAAATAAVARGSFQQPKILVEPAPASPAPAGAALKPGSVQPLRTMMREVVTAGTATALRDVPGEPVHGKTGTAEASADTHGWFVGWQGDVAFAVFVENGGDSTASAVPVAERFLRALN